MIYAHSTTTEVPAADTPASTTGKKPLCGHLQVPAAHVGTVLKLLKHHENSKKAVHIIICKLDRPERKTHNKYCV